MPITQDRMLKLIQIGNYLKDRLDLIRSVSEAAHVTMRNAGDDPKELRDAFQTIYAAAMYRTQEEFDLLLNFVEERKHFEINRKKNDNTRDAMRRMRFKTKLETQELNEAEELNQFIENLKNQELEFDFEKYVRQLSIVYDPSDRAKISDIIAIGISMGSGKEDRAQLDLLNKLLETKAILPTSFGGEYTVPGRKTSSEPQRLPIPTENESESESESESDSEPASLPNPEQGGLLTSAMVQLKKR